MPDGRSVTSAELTKLRLADAVAVLEAERDALRREVVQLRERQALIGRKLYRRGYLAGRAAARRGAPRETAPERHARDWAREILR